MLLYKQNAIKRLELQRFTAFREASLDLSPSLNVFVGENGVGKTHLLKLPYSIAVTLLASQDQEVVSDPNKASLEHRLARKLNNVFWGDTLGSLVHHGGDGQECLVDCRFSNPSLDLCFGFSEQSESKVRVDCRPSQRLLDPSVYLSTRELLTLQRGLVAFYRDRLAPMEDTIRDTCLLLERPMLKQVPKTLLAPLEEAMKGEIKVDGGRFYLVPKNSRRLEMPLVAEGLRKLATIAILISNGSLLENGFLFWDEPEANLNPRLIREVARLILHLASNAIQVFIATHSLFLLRELDILIRTEFRAKNLAPKFTGLHLEDGRVKVTQGATMDDIGDVVALDEELTQSNRYLDLEDAEVNYADD